MSATKRWLEDMIYKVETLVEDGLELDKAVRTVAQSNRITFAELWYWVKQWENVNV